MTNEIYIETKDPWWIKETEPVRVGGIDGIYWRTFKVRAIARPYIWVRNLLTKLCSA